MCMKLIIKNIAKIDYAEIKLNGITVIAGYNNTGKSTISKTFVAITNAFSNLEEQILNEKLRSLYAKIENWLEDYNSFTDGREIFDLSNKVVLENEEAGDVAPEFLADLIGQVFNSVTYPIDEPTDEDISMLGNDLTMSLQRKRDDYIRFIVEREFKRTFDMQVNQINGEECGSVSLQSTSCNLFASFTNNEIVDMEQKGSNLVEPIYIETKTQLDELKARRKDIRTMSSRDIFRLLRKTPLDTDFTFEEYQENKSNTKTINSILKDIVNGKLVNHHGNFYFRDDKLGEDVHIGNLASGLKNYIVIQTLIENGTLKRNGTLVIDEPEVNLHPEWQLKFANLLVLLKKEMGINILINTHSPYFINSIEYCSKKEKICSDVNYYLLDCVDGRTVCEDVTSNTDMIYRKLAEPILDLQKKEYELENGTND